MEETLEDYINWGVRQEMMVRFVSLLKKRCTQNRFSCWRPARPWREDRTLNSRHDTTRSFSSLLWPNEKRDDIEWRSPGRKNVKKKIAWRIARLRVKKAKAGSNGEQKLHARSLAAASFEYVHIIQQPGPGVLCPRQVNRVKRERENFSSFFPFDLNYSCSCVCVCVCLIKRKRSRRLLVHVRRIEVPLTPPLPLPHWTLNHHPVWVCDFQILIHPETWVFILFKAFSIKVVKNK